VTPRAAIDAHPVDTPLRVATRVLVEVTAWIAGTWVVARGVGPGAAAATFAVMVTVPAVFTVPGDKHHVVVPTAGSVRVAIELVLYVVATAGTAVIVDGTAAAVLVWVAATVTAAIQAPRWRWLLLHGRTQTQQQPARRRPGVHDARPEKRRRAG
jgi:hypothetical protein